MEDEETSPSYFQVFPIELWEIILDNVEDTDAILSIFDVLPQLKGLAPGKEFSWLIGHVMPLLAKQLNFNQDMKTCRLVSKRWKNAVHTSLDTHPDLLPYKSKNLRITENHFRYYRLPNIQYNLDEILWTDTTDYLLCHNPFPTRQLQILLDYSENNHRNDLNDAMEVLEKFGHHIHYFRIDICGRHDCNKEHFQLQSIKVIFECLACLPNLRFLYFCIDVSRCKQASTNAVFFHNEAVPFLDRFRNKVKQHVESIPGKLRYALEYMSFGYFPGYIDFNTLQKTLKIPLLPNLEVLDMTHLTAINPDIWNYLINSLVQHDQLKMLGIPDCNSRETYTSRFPNLTELHVNCTKEYGTLWLDEILAELFTPSLSKCVMQFSMLSIYNIFFTVSEYRIETLKLVGYLWDDYGYRSDVMFPSIQHIKLCNRPNIHYDFLKTLPCLKNLSPALVDLIYEDEVDPGKARIVWKTLPSLQMITVQGNPDRQFVRD